MNDETVENVYAPPTADVEEDGAILENLITSLPRFTAWGVFGLSVITLGLYPIYWMYNRSKIINQIDNVEEIPGSLMISMVVFNVINLLSGFLEGVFVDSDSLVIVGTTSTLLGLVAAILNLVLIFKIRNRIHAILNARSGTRKWCGGVLTFFFQAWYLQYKINQAIDDLS